MQSEGWFLLVPSGTEADLRRRSSNPAGSAMHPKMVPFLLLIKSGSSASEVNFFERAAGEKISHVTDRRLHVRCNGAHGYLFARHRHSCALPAAQGLHVHVSWRWSMRGNQLLAQSAIVRSTRSQARSSIASIGGTSSKTRMRRSLPISSSQLTTSNISPKVGSWAALLKGRLLSGKVFLHRKVGLPGVCVPTVHANARGGAWLALTTLARGVSPNPEP